MGKFHHLPKRDVAILKRKLSTLQRYLGGIKYMTRLPDIVIVLDQQKEYIALRECAILGIPTISLVDTNCDPDLANISIPANDDTMTSIRLILNKLVFSICEGRSLDEALATREDGSVVLTDGLIVALEIAVVQVDKIMDSECRELFFAAATCVLSHIHLCKFGFHLSSVILSVPAEARDHAAKAVKGPVEALVRRFTRVAAPSSQGAAEADDASDVDNQPPTEGATGGGSS
ncbi:hypothetical protein ZWY2020_054819 [Hordeum vulgare]|nr:hypothetical protein ZWY2020_054819 [Hordeum vulgare]